MALVERLRDPKEVMGMMDSVARHKNIGPDKHGLIPEKYIGALQRLRIDLDKLGA